MMEERRVWDSPGVVTWAHDAYEHAPDGSRDLADARRFLDHWHCRYDVRDGIIKSLLKTGLAVDLIGTFVRAIKGKGRRRRR